MNKILKILSILIIGFVMFSCSTPTNDPTPYVPEPSNPETPVETPKYSVTFVIDTNASAQKALKVVANALNNFSEFKNLEEGTEVKLYNIIYANENRSEFTSEKNENSYIYYDIVYENVINSVTIGNEDVEVVLKYVTPNEI